MTPEQQAQVLNAKRHLSELNDDSFVEVYTRTYEGVNSLGQALLDNEVKRRMRQWN